MARYLIRSLSLAGSLAGAVCNLAVTLRLLALSRSLGWETESEWEGSADVWAVDSVRIVWGLLLAYFAAAATACFIGFVGLAKHIRLFVRIYRDYSIADFVFVFLTTISVSYMTFTSSYVRSSVCEELSRHSELMRDMGEMGLSLENCEMWFERAVVAVLGVMFILIVVRLHIVIALSQYYSHISRDLVAGPRAHFVALRAIKTDVPLQRIYLMPTPTTPSCATPGLDARADPFAAAADGESHITVYATVPLGGLTEEEARRMHAAEAWVAAAAPAPLRAHRHAHSHSHAHSHAHGHRHHAAGRSSSSSRSAHDEKTSFVQAV